MLQVKNNYKVPESSDGNVNHNNTEKDLDKNNKSEEENDINAIISYFMKQGMSKFDLQLFVW